MDRVWLREQTVLASRSDAVDAANMGNTWQKAEGGRSVDALLFLSLLSPLWRVFTIIYLKQAMFLGHIELQLFSIFNFCYR